MINAAIFFVVVFASFAYCTRVQAHFVVSINNSQLAISRGMEQGQQGGGNS